MIEEEEEEEEEGGVLPYCELTLCHRLDSTGGHLKRLSFCCTFLNLTERLWSYTGVCVWVYPMLQTIVRADRKSTLRRHLCSGPPGKGGGAYNAGPRANQGSNCLALVESLASVTRGKCAIVSPPSTQHCPSASHLFFTLVLCFRCCGLCTFPRCYWQWTNFKESYDPSGMGVRESPAHVLVFFSFLGLHPLTASEDDGEGESRYSDGAGYRELLNIY